MVTVEVDCVRVESALSAGVIRCPSCGDGVLGAWGFARVRVVVGIGGAVRPRRARCRSCAVTHVLLPVSMLLRRAYSAAVIVAALAAHAGGEGHRVIAVRAGIPASTVRGWLRAVTRRSEVLRTAFVVAAVAAGVDVRVPKATGSGCGDVLAAVVVAGEAIGGRFGGGFVGAVTATSVMVAVSGGRLLHPRWPVPAGPGVATPVASSGGADHGGPCR